MHSKYLKDKIILVTGVCGSIGSELVRHLLGDENNLPQEIRGIDNSETQLFFLDQAYLHDKRVNLTLVDIRDSAQLKIIMQGVDYVFHCAAMKHVVLCERSPEQALLTNIIGLQNIISASRESNVQRVIFTSSDKAVNPSNVMGTSKLMGERLITAANNAAFQKGPIFASTRFGNVLGSSGSVIPIFYNQIAKGGPITLTSSNMTRFVMSVGSAAKMVIDSMFLAKGGEVFITKMPVIRIADLAEAMKLELSPVIGMKGHEIQVIEIGVKPGEKIYEELMSDEEKTRVIELNDYFCVTPAFKGIYNKIDYSYVSEKIDKQGILKPYVSSNEKALSVNEIRQLLKKENLLKKPGELSDSRYWPGDKEVR